MPQIEPFVISIIKQPRPPTLSKPWEFKITQGGKVPIRVWCKTKSECNLLKTDQNGPRN